MQLHAMTMFVRTFFSWRLLRLKPSSVIVRNKATSWQSSIMNQKPNKLKYQWQDLPLEKLLSPWQYFGHIFPEAICCHHKYWQFIQVNSFQSVAIFCKTVAKSERFWMQGVSTVFVVVSSLLLLCSGSQNLQYWERMAESDLITDWHGRHMQANNPKTRLTWLEQRSKMC